MNELYFLEHKESSGAHSVDNAHGRFWLPVITLTMGSGDDNEMSAKSQSTSLENAEQIRARFKELLTRTNKEHPRAEDVRALSDLLGGNSLLNCGETLRVPVNWLS